MPHELFALVLLMLSNFRENLVLLQPLEFSLYQYCFPKLNQNKQSDEILKLLDEILEIFFYTKSHSFN